jgi:hypothetical protein
MWKYALKEFNCLNHYAMKQIYLPKFTYKFLYNITNFKFVTY